MAREGLFYFNLAQEKLFSVNMARRLEKLPTPGLKCLFLNVFEMYKLFLEDQLYIYSFLLDTFSTHTFL